MALLCGPHYPACAGRGFTISHSQNLKVWSVHFTSIYVGGWKLAVMDTAGRACRTAVSQRGGPVKWSLR